MNDCKYRYVFYEKHGDSPCDVCDDSSCEKSFYLYLEDDVDIDIDIDIDDQEDYW